MDERAGMTAERIEAGSALLEFLQALGVGDFVDEAPRDRFAETAREAEERAARRGTPARAEAATVHAAPPTIARAPAASASPVSPGVDAVPSFVSAASDAEAIDDARARARTATSLQELEAALQGFEGCNLRRTAKSIVFGSGAPDAALMVVGEAPGREEDEAGVPFVGRSGRLLDRMLLSIGLERDAVRVTNTVPWRPPGNRAPTPAETEMCLPFLQRQIELVRPRILVCLGSPAAKALLSSDEGILRLRGRWSELTLGDDITVAATAMLHPAYLLRQPAQKRLAWRDLLAIRERLG